MFNKNINIKTITNTNNIWLIKIFKKSFHTARKKLKLNNQINKYINKITQKNNISHQYLSFNLKKNDFIICLLKNKLNMLRL